jgi:A/G-specific adenine glycosylase
VTRPAKLRSSGQPRAAVPTYIRKVPAFRAALLEWYRASRRDLPWRRTDDPYKIWLSEIMLQQTRVAAVIDHYERFLKRFPTLQTLAAAKEASVLALWSGLGYYRRARNLHAAAKLVKKEHAGEFPRTSEELRALPGIGRYTAAAIASIAFGEAVAVVDGNVERVIARITGRSVSGEQAWAIAEQMLSREHPGDFNQAMMELGATVCLPGEPACSECPVREFCRTRGRHASTAKAPRQHRREIACALSQSGGSILLIQRRADEQHMPGMWELPQVALEASDEQLFSVRHSITVTDYKVRVVSGNGAEGTWFRRERLNKLPLTGLTKKILRRAGIIENK